MAVKSCFWIQFRRGKILKSSNRWSIVMIDLFYFCAFGAGVHSSRGIWCSRWCRGYVVPAPDTRVDSRDSRKKNCSA